MHRFYLPPPDWNASSPALDPAESHHALDVLRLRVGDRLTVFDGAGGEAGAQIAAVDGRRAHLKILHQAKTQPLPCAITLAQAVPKGKNMDFIIQKSVELGAARVAPLLSDRTVVQLDPGEAGRKRDKWREIALEACKQCGQNRLPEILSPQTPKAFLESAERQDLLLIASLQPDARTIKTVLSGHPRPASVCVMVGPEGDFTPAELSLAKSHGFQPVTLGPIILRTETAALYCLSVLAHEL
ncbi:MAG TPA: 16S rRNA (uracil(1498)-N(3))-methyltransferase, partial [Terrimicrobiaceae bacterium]|nr:16S rRNA (uracil(1498)-N(3))-methyltransferase [Terrimicrobiaceae bacterium]